MSKCSQGCSCGRHKGHPQTEETRRRISASHVGMTHTEESRAKMSASHRGKTQSPETRAKRSESLKRAWSVDERRKHDGFVDSYGYKIIGAEPDHPLARFGKLSEHRMVLYDRIGPGPHSCHWGCGRELDWGGILGIVSDHINGDRLDNSPENLVPSCTACNMHRARAGNPPDWRAT